MQLQEWSKKNSQDLPDQLALVFDGWDSGEGHYVGQFATFSNSKSENGYDTVLLLFSPLEN